jgi:16S rRNA (cytosine967-C5)-methyltransferase
VANTSVSATREVSYDALSLIIEQKVSNIQAIESVLKKLDKKDKKIDRYLAQEIMTGTLRWFSKLYWILQKTSKRDLDKTSPQIRAALLGGTYQIFYMESMRDRIVVNESVEYIRNRGQANACSFVNGILRQISSRAEYFQKPDKETRKEEYLALQYAHPEWLVRRWAQYFRSEKLETILAAGNQPPPVAIRINPRKTASKDLQLLLLKNEKTHTDRRPLRSALTLKENPKLNLQSLHSQGYYTIQDEGEQLVGFLAEPAKDQRILQVGLFSHAIFTHLAELKEDPSTAIVGMDSDPGLVKNAQAQLLRLEFADQAQVVEANFLEWRPGQNEVPDKIVLCPPNSRSGVLRRLPELKLQLSESEMTKTASEAKQYLNHAIDVVKPGGEVLYFVQSFDWGETEGLLAELTKDNNDLEVVPLIARMPDYYKKYVTRSNLLLLYPGNPDNIDGIAAFIVKKK